MWMRNRAGDEIEIVEPIDPSDTDFQGEVSRRMASGFRQVSAQGAEFEPCGCGAAEQQDETEGGEG